MWAKAYQCLLTVWPISGLYEDPVSAKNRPEIFQKIFFGAMDICERWSMARIGKPYIFWGVHGRICPDNSAIKELHKPVIR
jgi:hypothetical protein